MLDVWEKRCPFERSTFMSGTSALIMAAAANRATLPGAARPPDWRDRPSHGLAAGPQSSLPHEEHEGEMKEWVALPATREPVLQLKDRSGAKDQGCAFGWDPPQREKHLEQKMAGS